LLFPLPLLPLSEHANPHEQTRDRHPDSDKSALTVDTHREIPRSAAWSIRRQKKVKVLRKRDFGFKNHLEISGRFFWTEEEPHNHRSLLISGYPN
jgi:hypothetical protein